MEYITVGRKYNEGKVAFTDVPIKDIVGMVGFKAVPHFNRVFKEYTGTTPAEFRRSAANR